MAAKAPAFDLRFDITGPTEDGTLVALCRDMPIVVAATSEQELRERMARAVNEVVERLRRLSADERRAFLEEAGVQVRHVKLDEETRTATFPVSLSVAAR